jgi:signal transduction histidine kinase
VAAALVGSVIWLVPTDGFVLVGYVAAFFLYYSVSAHVEDRYLAAATVLIGVVLGVAAAAQLRLPVGEYMGAVVGVVAPAAVGVLVRRQRLQNRRLEELTLHLERDRNRREQAAVVDERVRIARELHDLVSHALTVVAVHADAAEAALERNPELTKVSLSTIRGSAHEALTEMRRLLGVLRTRPDDGGPDGADLEPLPGLAQLPALVERARSSGVGVDVTVEGSPVPLPHSLDLAAYRILQETLTNAIKHAAGAPASISLRWRPDALEIEVRDDGPGASAPPSPDAQGLVGMRERVRIHGGTFEAGTADGGGFAVRAVLPIEAA